MTTHERLLVVGGGVIGCSLAYHLAGAGRQVTLLERATIGSEASSAAAGMLAPLAESDEPGVFLELAVAGLRAFQEDAAAVEAVSGLSIEYMPVGIIRTAGEQGRAEALRARIAWARQLGLPVRWLDGAEVRRLEPSLGDETIGGLDSPEEAHVHPRRLTAALAQGAARRGAEIREGAEVEALIRHGDEVSGVRLTNGEVLMAGSVVLAGGAWSRMLGRGAVELPVAPVLGQYLLLRSIPCPFKRVLYGEHVYLLPRADGTIYVGATEEPEAGFDKRSTAQGIRGLLNAAASLVPSLDRAEIVSVGSGLRPGTYDHMPILGHVSGVPGLSVAAGHFRNGVLLSLITGRLMTELLVYGRSSIDLVPFSPGRFNAAAPMSVAASNGGLTIAGERPLEA